jgi:hypothetical protein
MVHALCINMFENVTMNKNENLPANSSRQQDEKENVNDTTQRGKIDMERGKATDCPGDGEGDRNDTKEMDDVNRDK